ncbi:MAG: Tim44/TimA family putative adaptor protein [Alphaproteobacteria bacterium]|mgnify:CR=1 FL=1|nr:translocase [Alphaproteobacteria bacterium]MCS5597781.1 Tim44/TimA family putative adaptor protein [Alphaproteobacteria bacterium]
METDILIYAIIAAVLVVWLRNILGTRNGDEQQRPNPYVESEQNKAKPKNIVGLDGQPFVVDMENPLKKLDLSDELIKEAEGLSRQMRDFDAISFVENAKNAFVMVVEAFAKGEKDVLEMLLAPSVYESFEGAIKEREKKGETVSTEIHAVRKADIVDIQQKNGIAYVSIRFTADETCVIRDKDDNILSGDPERITEMVDVWTFGRKIKAKEPTWLLFETRDDEVEDHKTPIPEASDK